MEFGPDKYEFSLTHWLDFAININSRIGHNSLQFKLKNQNLSNTSEP